MPTKKQIFLKRTALFIALLFFVGISFLSYELGKNMLTEDGKRTVETVLERFGLFAPILFIIGQTLNEVIPFIPGEPVEIIGGVLFGWVFGAVYCLAGVFLGSYIAYKLSKRYGKKLIDSFVSKKKTSKLKFLKSEKKVSMAVFILFLLPGVPKDILAYIVPIFTDIPPKKYFPICTFARFPSIVTSTLVGDKFGEGQFLFAIIVFVATALVGLIIILIKERKK
jgi:uncharacterized membrane protein YdjX (TVP38/TMEM64 family)